MKLLKMKKYTLYAMFLTGIFLSGCSGITLDNQSVEEEQTAIVIEQAEIQSEILHSNKYQEFYTPFTDDIGTWDGEVNQDEEIKKFIENRGKNSFWSSGVNLYRQNIQVLKDNSERVCGDTKDSCTFKSDIKVPDGYRVNGFTFLYVDENNSQYNFLIESSSGKDFLFMNDKIIEIGNIIAGANGGVENISLINDKISFLYRKSDLSDKELKERYECYEKYSYVGGGQEICGYVKSHLEYFYEEPNFSQRVGVDSVSKIFEYNGKIGFVGEKNGKWAVYFDQQKVSEDFDQIRTTACCAIRTFPFKIYDNGVIFFMGKRGEQYILAESRL